MAERPLRPTGSAAPVAPGARRERLLRQKPRAAGRRSDASVRRALRRRPQRHGQDHDVQGDHGPGAGVDRIDPLHGRGTGRPLPGRDRADRHRLCAAGPPAVAIADGRRASAAGVRRAKATGRRNASTTSSRALPSDKRNAGGQLSGGEQQMLAISRALLINPRLLDHGRTDRRPCAGHRRACRGHAGAARRGRRRLHPRHRAEYRRCNPDVRSGRDHGQRPGQSRHRLADARSRSRPAAAPAGRWPPQPR